MGMLLQRSLCSLRDMRRRAFHIMAKPIGPVCNLDCSYCFYLEKETLYGQTDGPRRTWAMREEVLESYVRQYIEAIVAGETEYQLVFTSAIACDNVFAVQFHPEKSSKTGLRMIANFLRWKP